MSGDKRARLKQWLANGGANLHPLTFPQRELWETAAIPVNDPANHICCLINVRGLLVPRACELALQHVIERQEVLRLSFLPGKERPLQLIRATGEASLEFRDLSPAQARPETIEELAYELFRKPFDVLQGPLYRATMLRRAADDLVLVFAIHHAIADGWTLGVFVRELFGGYIQQTMGGPETLPPVPLTYSAWGAAERAFWQPAELEPRIAFWKSTLRGARRLWDPPGEFRPLCRFVSHIPAELGNRVREFARRSGATLFSTLLTTFQLALSRWTGTEDFVIGVPIANRSKQTIRETMGYCSWNVPLRAQVNRTRSFADSLRHTHQSTVDCFANAIPFAELMRALEDSPAPGHHPIFQVRFALQNHPIPDVTLPNLSANLRMRSTGTARFDFGCEITEQDDAMEIAWLFRTNMFSEAEVCDFDRLFQGLLAGICHSSESRTPARAF